MSGVFLFGDIPGAVFVTDAAGKTSVASGIPISDLTDLGQALLAGLVTDADSFSAPTVAATAGLTPALITDSDTFYTPIIGEAVLAVTPSFYTDDDTVHVATIAPGAATLSPSRVDDVETFYVPALAAGTVTLLPALVADADAFSTPLIGIALVLFPALVAVDDNVLAATVVPGSKTLLPARVTDSDTIYAPAAIYPQVLRPPLVSAGEAVYAAYSIETPKPPKEQRLRPGRLNSDDAFFSPRFGLRPPAFNDNEVVFVAILVSEYPLRPAAVAGDDVVLSPFIAMQVEAAAVVDTEAIYSPLLSLYLTPQVVVDDESIPAADVGWQVIAEFTDDSDTIFDIELLLYNELLPDDVWRDEDTLETYPFFIQAIIGGIPVPPPLGILTGTVAHPRRLTGSMSRRPQLTGSITSSTRRVLTGSLRHR